MGVPPDNRRVLVSVPENAPASAFPVRRRRTAGLASELHKIDQFLTVEDSLSAAGGLQGALITLAKIACRVKKFF
jgi:hypothetical protein